MEREHLCNFTLAGFTYYEGPKCFKDLSIGTTLRLEYEEGNGYDPNAVAMYYQTFKIGFIPKTENRIPAKLLRLGLEILEVTIQKIDPTAHPEEQIGVVIHLVNTAKQLN